PRVAADLARVEAVGAAPAGVLLLPEEVAPSADAVRRKALGVAPARGACRAAEARAAGARDVDAAGDAARGTRDGPRRVAARRRRLHVLQRLRQRGGDGAAERLRERLRALVRGRR